MRQQERERVREPLLLRRRRPAGVGSQAVVNVVRHQRDHDVRVHSWFFWTYNAGVLWSVTCMTLIGIRTVEGQSESGVLAHPSGGGHILLTVGFALFFVCLYRPVTTRQVETVLV
ncbi:DUF2871 family protein [Nocardia tengchongensis]|uniref:DUF2871 family protein n=1 Tax=Nocardia tengchongensis TaxID=2055889 RepID=UPI003685ACDF